MNYTTFTSGTASVIMSLYPGKIIVIKYDKVKPNQSKEIKESWHVLKQTSFKTYEK